MLWHFTAKYAPAGDIGRWTDDAISRACDWTGDPSTFVLALESCRWIDRLSNDARYMIHDWHDHAEDAVHMALGRTRKRMADGAIPKLTRLSKEDQKAALEDYKAVPMPVCTQKTHTVHTDRHTENALPLPLPCLSPPMPLPSPPKDIPSRPRTAAPSLSEIVWKSCEWRKEGKKKTLGTIAKVIKLVAAAQGISDEEAAGYITRKAAAYTQAVQATEMRFRPLPETWFNRGSYDDDPDVWLKAHAPPISPKDQAQRAREAREPPQEIDFKVLRFGGNQ